jgi:uncharacterized protein (TIGR03435 family)
MLCFGQDSPPRGSDVKPNFPPSYEVHIAPTQMAENSTSGNRGPDYRSERGYDLRGILAKLYHVDASRVDLPSTLDNGARYDFAMVLPAQEGPEKMDQRVQEAIAEHFHVTIAFETRPMDVYVLTAIPGQTQDIKPSGELENITSSSMASLSVVVASPQSQPSTQEEIQNPARKLYQPVSRAGLRGISFIGGVSVHSSTMEEFCHSLEMGLDRLVIDETNLKDRYDLAVEGAGSTQEFMTLLRDQLGLVVSPGKRDVRMLVVKNKALN